MTKAKDAFRTISEVSEALDTPAHVLRFWESKFTQIKPVKRAGGRRYYRPDDLALLAGIKKLLHDQGMTIKGAQKLLRENGVKHVVSLGEDLAINDGQMIDHASPVHIIRPQLVEDSAPEIDEAEIVEEALSPDAARDDMDEQDAPQVFDAQDYDDDPAQDETDDADPPEEFIPNPVTPFVRQTSQEPAALPETPAKPEPIAAALAVPPLPDAFPDVEGRFFAAYQHADNDALQAHAAQIAPLITRLTDLRDQMQRG